MPDLLQSAAAALAAILIAAAGIAPIMIAPQPSAAALPAAPVLA